MNKLFYALILIFYLSLFSFAQTSNLPCPEITVSGPQGLVNPGDKVKFTANVESVNNSLKTKFEWKVSKGEITSGQGTNQISVATTLEMDKSILTAIVQIKGLNSICKKEFSETAVIDNGTFDPVSLDIYSKLSLKDELERIDNFLVQIINDPKSKGYILFEIEKTEDLGDVKKRLMSVFNHIFKERGINRDLIHFNICYAENNQTTFQRIPEGASVPEVPNCEKAYIDLK